MANSINDFITCARCVNNVIIIGALPLSLSLSLSLPPAPEKGVRSGHSTICSCLPAPLLARSVCRLCGNGKLDGTQGREGKRGEEGRREKGVEGKKDKRERGKRGNWGERGSYYLPSWANYYEN